MCTLQRYVQVGCGDCLFCEVQIRLCQKRNVLLSCRVGDRLYVQRI